MADPQRIAACQFEPVVGDVDHNVEAIKRAVADLPSDVAVAVLPELCASGYDLDAASDGATPVPGPLTDRLVAVADAHDVTVVAGVPERDGDQLYNSLVAVDGDGVRATYRKQFLWRKEAEVFTAGHGPTTVETDVGTIGLSVCFDLSFPEVGLDYARAGCDVLAVSAAWRTVSESDWRLLLRARAFDGPYYVVGANHTGDQRGREHAARSLVADPFGTIVTEAGEDPGHVVAEVDREEIEAGREWNPVREARGWSS